MTLIIRRKSGLAKLAYRSRVHIWPIVIAAMGMIACSPEAHYGRKHADPSAQLDTVRPFHRTVYRFSVVPGGVYSAEELLRIRRVDAVVAQHYAAIGPRVQAISLSQGVRMYVSYRVQDKIYWTARKHLIAKGEQVLSDGSNLVRTRCGNRLSSVPMIPVRLPEEPSPVNFTTPDLTVDLTLSDVAIFPLQLSLPPSVPEHVPSDAPQVPGGRIYIPSVLVFPLGLMPETPSIAPALGFGSLGSGPILRYSASTAFQPGLAPPIPIPVPETGSGLLSGVGFLLVGLLKFSGIREKGRPAILAFTRLLPSIM